MPSEAPALPTQTEKPQHYMYLKEFRTQQCPLFLQHKCTQHRPYTCFHWHFMNQRRRRPVRRRDGTFNYSPDVYCTKYDETTGICPDGDDCPFLHRTAGDTERRYHLRYYKTCTCVHETDAKGHCVKNGPHCAFAHGAHDLRPPVYDLRELQSANGVDKNGLVEPPSAATQLERDRIINEDPRWNDTNYVLANYKTEPCKRPPRLCRQGYACPQYHNNRDKRRSPKKYKYRSTPCPNVKHGDEWGDSAQCESGDSCPYCHTRTEQQFHPEIYKSTKCNDMVQTGYCPRGPFCAFAHVEQEMMTQREIPANDNSLAAFVTNVLPQMEEQSHETEHEINNILEIKTTNGIGDMNHKAQDSPKMNGTVATTNGTACFNGKHSMSVPDPLCIVTKGRSGSTSSSILSETGSWKAPGSEREDQVKALLMARLRQQLQIIDNDPSLDFAEKSKRKQNLLLISGIASSPLGSNLTSGLGSLPATPSSTVSSTMSPHAPSFYPAGETVESVIGNALDEDLDLGELSLSSIDRDLAKDNDDTNSVSSSISAGLAYNGAGYLGTSTSVPVTIPSRSMQRGSIGSLSPTSSSPFGPSLLCQSISRQDSQVEQAAAAAFLNQPNTKYPPPQIIDYNSMSPLNNGVAASPLMSSSFSGVLNGNSEVHRLREELSSNKAKLQQWEERIAQARNACEAWKKEAEDSNRKAKTAEEDRVLAVKQKDEALSELNKLKQSLETMQNSPYLRCLQRVSELSALPVHQLKQIKNQLKNDIEQIDKVVFQQQAMKCMVCQEKSRNVITVPCNHFVLCDPCANKRNDCPLCHTPIAQRTGAAAPL